VTPQSNIRVTSLKNGGPDFAQAELGVNSGLAATKVLLIPRLHPPIELFVVETPISFRRTKGVIRLHLAVEHRARPLLEPTSLVSLSAIQRDGSPQFLHSSLEKPPTLARTLAPHARIKSFLLSIGVFEKVAQPPSGNKGLLFLQ
jgi:hypothetical protein